VIGPTSDVAIRQIEPLVELGVTHFTIAFHDRRTLDQFARCLIPTFNG
jgi:hypothetical protein